MATTSKEDILKDMQKVVGKFGWDANLLNGFWINLNSDDIKPADPVSLKANNLAMYCNSVTLPSINIDYEDVTISINKFKTPVPVGKTKSDLILEVTGGTAEYIKNISKLFKSTISKTGNLDISTLYTITVHTFSANYKNLSKITYKNCYIKSIGEVSFEQSATNSFFKCTYTFSIGWIK